VYCTSKRGDPISHQAVVHNERNPILQQNCLHKRRLRLWEFMKMSISSSGYTSCAEKRKPDEMKVVSQPLGVSALGCG
jgi:hypothetical protein